MGKAGQVRAAAVTVVVLTLTVLAVQGEPVHTHPLGAGGLQFLRGPANVRFEEREHGPSREYAHKGDLSETIRITAEQGDPVSRPFVHYVYLTPRAPVAPELRSSLWLRSKSPGVQLLARAVLPRVRNPKRPEEPFTTMLEGTTYTSTNNWQRLELGDVPELLRRRIPALRLELNTEVDAGGAYIDQLVLNLYAGPGESQVWVNEVEIGPVIENRAPSTLPQRPREPIRKRAGPVEINRDQLLVDGKRFFFRGIRHSDTPIKSLKLAGFNTIFVKPDTPQIVLDEVAAQELFAVPTLDLPRLDGGVALAAHSGEEFPRERLSRFLNNDKLLFWYLGGGRGAEQVETVSRAAASVREIDPDRPVGVGAWDGLWPYSRNVDMLAVHRWPLHTSLELANYRDWLTQRRLLARPGTFTWTWVQTHLPEWHTSLVYDKQPTAAFDEPIGPQPEHIRLLTYLGLATGCRGLGFWSDRFLADTHQGRDRLLAVALLNLELQLLEPVLLSVMKSPLWIDTSNPNVKAAVLYGDMGILVLPIWLGPGSQMVPGQSAAAGLRLTAPMVPPNYQAYEVTPVEVRSLVPKRIAGGQEIILPDFGLTAAIVFTGDMSSSGPLVHWQEQIPRIAKPAADWMLDMARLEFEKIRGITEQLASLAPPVPGSNVLLRDAETRLQTAAAFHAAGRAREAYHEANRALRPVRQLMRLQWEQAIASVGSTAASPFTASYFTLPRHWQFLASIKSSKPDENVLRGGGFEVKDQSWSVAQTTLDEVTLDAHFTNRGPREGSQCLELTVTKKDPKARIAALERTFLGVNSPAVSLPPGTLVRISGWMRVPGAIAASADGALIYDSIGGEPLSVRVTEATDWRQVVLYRRVPSSGQFFVTLALTGIGSVQFDDVRIEAMGEMSSPH